MEVEAAARLNAGSQVDECFDRLAQIGKFLAEAGDKRLGDGVRGAAFLQFEQFAVDGGERPSQSAKVVDVKLCRQVEVVGNHEGLGKNGRLFWHKNVEGKRPFAHKHSGNIHRPTRPSQAVSA